MTKTIVLISLGIALVIFLYVRVLWATRAHGIMSTAVALYQIIETLNAVDIDNYIVTQEDIEPFWLSVVRIFNWNPVQLIHDPEMQEAVVTYTEEFVIKFEIDCEDEE